MALPRESTFLPTIKCSNCGNEVEISLMGEHLCDRLSTPELSPPLDTNETFGKAYDATRAKYLRTPPLVDTGVANRYQNHGQLTPVSHPSSSRNASPKTPSGRSGINRNYNDEFAPEIAQTEDSHRSPQGYRQRPGGYGGFNSQMAEHETSNISKPPTNEAQDIFPRLNGTAGGYGGFGRQPSGPENPAVQGSAPETNGFLQRINDMAGAAFDDAGRRPSAANKAAFPQRKDSLDHWDAPPDLTVSHSNPQKYVRQNGREGAFNDVAQGEGASRGITRAETFPKLTYPSNEMHGRRPSAPNQQSEMQRRPSAPFLRTGDINRRPSMGPDTSRRPPPRTSLIRAHGNSSSVDLDKEFGTRNPYHTPTDSMSSGYSTASEHSTKASSNGGLPRIESKKSDAIGQFRQPQSQLQQQQPPPARKNSTVRTHGNARPELRIDPAIQAPLPSAGRFVESPYSVSPRDDRYDPAIQHGMLGRRGQESASPPRQLGFERGYGSNERPNRQGVPTALPVRKGSRDPLHPPTRGDCKACRMPITGKSISSADGRLTGKYHKACFVCATCSEPFSSAEFYVHHDKPYCETHYHKLNGSLCGTCQRGIEGQYLEDEMRIKYHVGCFRCLDCGMSLSDGYFEIDGKSYCERDARRRKESTVEAVPPVSKQEPTPMPTGIMAPPPLNRAPSSRGMAAMNTGAGMERGPYGVVPGSRGDRLRLNKRMTRIGVI